MNLAALDRLQRQIIACKRCPRLIRYGEKVVREKRRRFRDEEYWGKPVPSFGDPAAKMLIVGLAPGAHGSNRTGRMFTGDRSGGFLYRALYQAGLANQLEAVSPDDGLKLRGCYITAVARCAPPQNKPQPNELRNCQPYLEKEMELLTHVRAVLALGRIAFDNYLRVVSHRSAELQRLGEDSTAWSGSAAPLWGKAKPRASTACLRPAGGIADRAPREVFPPRSSLRFAHGADYQLPGGLPRLFASYHPSQQNTQTGRLTPEMFRQVLDNIREFLAGRTRR